MSRKARAAMQDLRLCSRAMPVRIQFRHAVVEASSQAVPWSSVVAIANQYHYNLLTFY